MDIFRADGRGRAAYKYFHDVVVFFGFYLSDKQVIVFFYDLTCVLLVTQVYITFWYEHLLCTVCTPLFHDMNTLPSTENTE